MVGFRLLNRVVGLASILVLVRLLAPEDFGLVALAFAFAAAIEASTALGLEAQLMRATHPDRDLYDTAFTLNLLRGLLLGVVVALGAAPAAAWMREPQLEGVMLALAALAVLGSVGNVAVVDFLRALDFRREFVFRAVPRIAQAVAGIGLALWLQNHWALLLAILVATLFSIVLGYAMRPYRPRLTLVAWRALIVVSAWSWLLGVTTMLRDRLDNLVVGRLLGAGQLGIYTVSVEISSLPVSEMVGPVCRAAGPGFAAGLRGDAPKEAADAFLRILALTGLVALPAGFGISLLSGPVVAVALGPAWAEAAPLIALLSVSYIVLAFGMLAGALLTAHLRIRDICFVTGGAAVLRIGILVVIVPAYGLLGIGWGVGIALLVENAVLLLLALRASGLRVRALAPHAWRPPLATAIMVLVLWGLGLGWAGMPGSAAAAMSSIALGAAGGALVYAGVTVGLWLMAGRPAGAERDMISLTVRGARAAMSRLPGRGAPDVGAHRQDVARSTR
jgi:O-antigen/teichoic acid export membrane protein